MADQLATPGDLASLLDVPVNDRMTLLVECGTAVVQAAADGQRIVEVVDDEAELMGLAGSWLQLPQIPVTAVPSVTLDGETLTLGTDFKRFGSRLWRRGGWAACAFEPSELTVVYTHGYPAGDQKLQFGRSAVLGLIRDVYDNPGGSKSLAVDDYQEVFSALSTHMEGTPALRAMLRKQYGRRGGLARVGGI